MTSWTQSTTATTHLLTCARLYALFAAGDTQLLADGGRCRLAQGEMHHTSRRCRLAQGGMHHTSLDKDAHDDARAGSAPLRSPAGSPAAASQVAASQIAASDSPSPQLLDGAGALLDAYLANLQQQVIDEYAVNQQLARIVVEQERRLQQEQQRVQVRHTAVALLAAGQGTRLHVLS